MILFSQETFQMNDFFTVNINEYNYVKVIGETKIVFKLII